MVLGSGDQRQGLGKSEHALAWESKVTGKTGKKVPLGTADRDSFSWAWHGNGGDQRLFPAPRTLADRPALLWCRHGRLPAD